MRDPAPTPVQAAIHRAMCRANPDVEGSLMRELKAEGVAGPVRQLQERMRPGRTSRRSRYVQGWRPS